MGVNKTRCVLIECSSHPKHEQAASSLIVGSACELGQLIRITYKIVVAGQINLCCFKEGEDF